MNPNKRGYKRRKWMCGTFLAGFDFNEVKGKTKISDSKWKDLLDHFNQPGFVLVNDHFEFPDLLGAAYEYLIKYFADSAGKKGGEFYTPAEVVRLLVQLTKPEAGNTVYDPTVGSGGFLIQAHQYVEEQGQNPDDLMLYGQDSNGTVWSICNMNMILHNITRFTIENADTLEDPQTEENGRLLTFDRVLANPPFSQNYSRETMTFTHRFREWCPESGKKADLMFVQHMLACLKRDGHMATIMPHGVLFRGGKEKLTSIKEKLVPLGVLDVFKSAGVFVNWWQQIRFDLKTIVSTGWHQSLIPDPYLIAAFFQAESDAIDAVEALISEKQGELAEAVENAQEVSGYEPDEDENVTAAVIKKALKSLGGDGFVSESKMLIEQIDFRVSELDPDAPSESRKIKALEKDRDVLESRIATTDKLLAEIGGQISEDEAKTLILKKLYDIASRELERYLNTEKRRMIAGVENLWDKYAVSSRELETEREQTLGQLNAFLSGLGYLEPAAAGGGT